MFDNILEEIDMSKQDSTARILVSKAVFNVSIKLVYSIISFVQTRPKPLELMAILILRVVYMLPHAST
jgi:hypothetical protein